MSALDCRAVDDAHTLIQLHISDAMEHRERCLLLLALLALGCTQPIRADDPPGSRSLLQQSHPSCPTCTWKSNTPSCGKCKAITLLTALLTGMPEQALAARAPDRDAAPAPRR